MVNPPLPKAMVIIYVEIWDIELLERNFASLVHVAFLFIFPDPPLHVRRDTLLGMVVDDLGARGCNHYHILHMGHIACFFTKLFDRDAVIDGCILH